MNKQERKLCERLLNKGAGLPVARDMLLTMLAIDDARRKREEARRQAATLRAGIPRAHWQQFNNAVPNNSPSDDPGPSLIKAIIVAISFVAVFVAAYFLIP